jgi:Glycosyl transferases group 1/Glycosyl transferase 4-like
MTRCILVVAMANSVHTLRWLRMVNCGQHKLVLLPCIDMPALHEFSALPRVRNKQDLHALDTEQLCLWDGATESAEAHYDTYPLPIGWRHSGQFIRPATIVSAVRALQPDLVHSLEIQHASYPCLAAAKAMGTEFPRWIVSNWGSDLYLYKKLAVHRPILEALMNRIDALHSECRRDGAIARQLGYLSCKPQYFMPGSGGEDFTRLPVPLHPPSRRDIILVKGYHGWSGRALHVLSAILLSAPRIQHMRVRLVLANDTVAAMANEVSRVTGLDIRAEPWSDDQAVPLQRMASARVAVGVGISDGIGTSFLEAMALGAFPVSATTACVSEWIVNGEDGAVVDPHDVRALADAIARAANDDALVDSASQRNRRLVEQRWNVHANRAQALDMYRSTMEITDGRPQ